MKWHGVEAKVSCIMALNDHMGKMLKEKEETLRRQEELKDLIESFSRQVDKIQEMQETAKDALVKSKSSDEPPSVEGKNYVIPTGSQVVNHGYINMAKGLEAANSGHVGAHLSSTSTVRGLLNKPPKFSNFSGEEPTPKNEVGFEAWLFRVQSVIRQYTKAALKEGILRSLTGGAANAIRFLGPESGVGDILDRLEHQYGSSDSSHTLLHEYFQITMEKGETINNFSIRLEGALNKVRRKALDEMSDAKAMQLLRSSFWHGLSDHYKVNLRATYDQPGSTFRELVTKAKVVEREGTQSKTVLHIKSKAATVTTKSGESEVDKLRKEGATEIEKLRNELVNLKASIVTNVKGKSSNNNSNKNPKDTRNQSKGPQTNASGPFKNGRPPIQCHGCKGWGHIKRECPTYLNGRGRTDRKGVWPPTQDKRDNEGSQGTQ